LASFLSELKGHFFPFLDETARLLIPLVGFMAHEEVFYHAVGAAVVLDS